MADPKDGTPGEVIAPTEPAAAQDADVANPGTVSKIKAEQAEKKEGKYGSEKVDPHKPPEKEEPEEKKELTWIEIELFDEDGKPVAGERYKVTLPNGKVDTGTLDKDGWARVAAFEKGTCKITFPNIDKDLWEFDQELPEKPKGGATI